MLGNQKYFSFLSENLNCGAWKHYSMNRQIFGLYCPQTSFELFHFLQSLACGESRSKKILNYDVMINSNETS